ncbi:amino acid ABC transporter permease [Rhodococcus sp. NPDC059968]|uniref:amino acid ABC transporter permease n=1 Tax=Rhodococcus sp. NPDC059968 TaxID=3347017 RepID=UPI00366D6C3C
MHTVVDHFGALMEGFAVTLALIGVSTVLALIGGTILASFRVSPIPLLQSIGSGYVETFRNVPTAVIYFMTLFAFPQLGIKIPFFWAAVAALAIYYSAFFCEAVRSGINAIPVGQFEAGRSIGLTFGGSLRYIVLPQAFRSVVPPLINVFIALTKSSAIASAFGVAELLTRAEGVIAEESQAVLWILAATSILYLVITIPAGTIANIVEKKVAVAR